MINFWMPGEVLLYLWVLKVFDILFSSLARFQRFVFQTEPLSRPTVNVFGRPVGHETPNEAKAKTSQGLRAAWDEAVPKWNRKMASRVLGLCNGGDMAMKRLMWILSPITPFFWGLKVMLFSSFSQHLHGLTRNEEGRKQMNEPVKERASKQGFKQERKKQRSGKI